jgi:pectate lyase-like protein
MSTQFSKRALTAGLGVGALALLAQTQDASADTPFTSFAFRATGAPTPRTMPDRLADVVNVKEFGALGNGSNDDQPAIQAAFNAAFTTAGVPNGTNSYLNREVFFPAGNYVLRNPITLTQVQGAKITGAGKQSTFLQNTVGGGGAVFVTNGFQNSHIAHLTLQSAASATAPALDLDWDGSGSVGLSGNTFLSLVVAPAGPGAAYGVRIGKSGHGGANNVFLCPAISNFAGVGFETASDAALNNVLIGGNFQSNAAGIVVTKGSVSVVDGTGFETQTGYDIEIKSTAAGGMSVLAASTESPNFFKATTSYSVALVGCSQRGSPTTFAYLDGCQAVVEACFGESPTVVSCRNGVRVGIVGYTTNTTTSAWLDAPAANLWFTPTNPLQGTIELENITYDRAGSAGGPFHIFKQRRYTTDGITLLTKSYTVA